MQPPLNLIGVSILLLLACSGCGPKSSSRAAEKGPSKAAQGPSTVFQEEGGSYYSEKCHYHLEFPPGVWVTVHNSDRRPGEGEGEEFGSRDGLFKGKVGCSVDANATAAAQAQRHLKAEPASFKLAFKTVKPGWYAYSGIRDGIVYYEKGIVNENKVIILSMEYQAAAKARFDAIAGKLSNSFEEYEIFTGTLLTDVADTGDDGMVFFNDYDPDSQNILGTICLYSKRQKANFVDLKEGQQIRVGGKMHWATIRKDPNLAQSGIYRNEVRSCVLEEVLTSPPVP